MIPYGRQNITQDDIDAVVEVLRSDFLTQGPVVEQFEQSVAEYVGAGYGVAVNSATSALHLACLALELGRGDWLWTSPITFVASANCGLYCGAQVDFVDIDSRTYNLCPVKLKQKLEHAERENRLPKVVVAVHFAGQSCDMAAIAELSSVYGFRVIEDASHAIGGKYRHDWVGACRFSDITVFSFHPVKIVTSGEGGVAMTNQPALAEKMARLRSHGVTRHPELMTHAPDGPWYYQQIELGFNYRMTELQAALGLSQIQRLDDFVARRHQLAGRYNERLARLPITLPWQHPDAFSGMHLYVIRLRKGQLSRSRREMFEALRAAGIGVNVHYIPVHTQPFFQAMGFQEHDFPEAVAYYQQAISLPLFHGMTDDQQDFVIEEIERQCEEGAQ